MVSVTFVVPENTKQGIKEFSWINWSELAREEFIKEEKRLADFERFKEIVSKSKFTQKDADELAKKVKQSMHERYKKLYPELE